MKKKIALLLVLLVAFNFLTAFKHPNAVWKLFPKYQKAVEQGDNKEIIKVGKEIFNVYSGMKMQKDISSVLAPKYKQVANAYIALGDYENAEKYMRKHLDITKLRINEYGIDERDNIIDGEAILRNITVRPQVYAFTKNPKSLRFYNEKYEPKMGVYFGRTASGQDENFAVRRDDSAVIIYVEMFQENIDKYDYIFKKQVASGKVIELAWNFPNHFEDAKKINTGAGDAYLESNLKYLAKLDIPILLRLGAEQNCWLNPNPEACKKAFRKVSNMAKRVAPKVAMVYSVNVIGDRNYTYESFYPGDEYVDWVGISLYANQFRKNDNSKQSQLNYGFGDYGNPVVLIKDLVDTFGDRKPIIISEGGSGHFDKYNNKDTTSYASRYLKYYYRAIPMVYPQVKAIMYFDENLDSTVQNYSLNDNMLVKSLYTKLTSEPEFINKYGEEKGGFVVIDKFSDKVSDYIYLGGYLAFPAFPNVNIKYSIDGKTLARTSEPGERVKIDLDQIPIGLSELAVKFDADNGYTKVLYYNVFRGTKDVVTIKAMQQVKNTVALPSTAKVKVDGKLVEFEAYNIGGNNFFKLRDIAMALNEGSKPFEIKWNGKLGMIDLLSGENYTSVGTEFTGIGSGKKYNASVSNAKLVLDGVPFKAIAYNIHDNNFFKLRDLGQLFSFGIEWNAKESIIEIRTDSDYTPE